MGTFRRVGIAAVGIAAVGIAGMHMRIRIDLMCVRGYNFSIMLS